jgi:uncharacterized protein (DUF433 family)
VVYRCSELSNVGTPSHRDAPSRETVTWAFSMAFEHITVDPERMGGQPCLRGLRFPGATVVAMVADGMTTDEMVSELPDLEADDIPAALRYAAVAVREQELPLRLPA